MAEQDKSKQDQSSGKAAPHPGMMGDGTEEQNLGQKGNPGARITEAEVDEAFGEKSEKKEGPAR